VQAERERERKREKEKKRKRKRKIREPKQSICRDRIMNDRHKTNRYINVYIFYHEP